MCFAGLGTGNNVVLGEGRAPFGAKKLEHFAGVALNAHYFLVLYVDESKKSQCELVLGEIIMEGVVGFGKPVNVSEYGCSHISIAALSHQR